MNGGINMLQLIPHTNGRYRWSVDAESEEMGGFDLRAIKDRLEIWSFGIYRKFRGNGYGQKMLQEAIQIAGDKKLVLYVLKENELAQHIYKKAGFEIIGEYMCQTAWVMVYSGNEAGKLAIKKAAYVAA